MGESNTKKGGGFLIEESSPKDFLSPEDFSEEHRMIRDMVRKFVANEVAPVRDKIEKQEFDVSKGLMKKAGELGLLGVDIPDTLGGAGMDKISAAIVAEEVGRAGSFTVTLGAHSGIGCLPIYYYGNKEQKSKYLPKLLSGEMIAAFCLTEPDAGSDAFSTKTKAVLSDDKKSYVLNGTKQFITNGGMAEMFIVFAKIDGEQHTGFIVEKSFEGVGIGEEEKKLGIKGSSTTQVLLDNVKVPAENILSEAGKGVKIALNILNTGRFKLGVGCLGNCKEVISNVLAYTSERKQFGQAINQFGMIQEKLATMAIRTFVLESAAYRAVGLIQNRVDAVAEDAKDHETEILKCIEEFAIECAIIKILGSEVLDYVVDEGMQSMGGYGYMQEYPLEVAYRDSRINRLFEGTNEINRLVVSGMLIKKGLKGELKLMDAIKAIQQEITELPSIPDETGDLLEHELRALANAKKGALLIAGAATQKFGKDLDKEEEVLALIADCTIELFALESVLLRAIKIAEAKGAESGGLYLDIARVYCFEAIAKMDTRLKEGAAAIYEGDELQILVGALKRFMKNTRVNVIGLRRNVAKHLIEAGQYSLGA